MNGPAAAPAEIRIRGARVHNLADLELVIPRDGLVVITGVSGSGKSSLAFDTLYAEGQRRYVESLSTFARQFLDQLQKPDVDSIEGLSPTIAIEQKGAGTNPRSTVGTLTEIADFLRLLYARAGEPLCSGCGKPIASQSAQEMVDRVLALPAGSRFEVLAPVVRGRKGSYRKELEEFRRRGFVRARIDGKVCDLSDGIPLERQKRHDIELVIDRLVAKPELRRRIAESIETALKLADGLALVDVGPGERDLLLSSRNACIDCGISLPELAPRLFSFNSPAGACPTCDGLGTVSEFDAALVVPDPDRGLGGGAIAPWSLPGRSAYYRKLIAALVQRFAIDPKTPWRELPAAARRGILEGGGTLEVDLGGRGKAKASRAWGGALDELARRYAESDESDRARLERFRSARPCAACDGSRLRPEARAVRLAGLSIAELMALPVAQTRRWFEALALPPRQAAIAERVLRELRDRLGFLEDVGLGYLSLDRPAQTLSGGEAQRIRLATQVGASLMGVVYVLDEPSIGLHPRDNQRLIASLLRLRDSGNSVIVVEHDEETMRAADWLIELGPGAGRHGGRVVAQGPLAAIEAAPDSPTGAYLSGRRSIPLPRARRTGPGAELVLSGCREHNLKNVELRLPLGVFSVVTGVSGSGKSSLVNDTLYRALAARLHAAQTPPGRFDRLVGAEAIERVIEVDQAPIGRTPRSNPATYVGFFDTIRKLFSQLPEARMRGYGPGRFSFNVKGGRCEACQGDGLLRVEMNFLPDLFVPCESCGARRYERETLAIRYRGHSIADVLELTVEAALELFANVPALRRPLETLEQVGLGYLALGQPATTLSGGEAQRIKLARELSRRTSGHTLYLLDEPTTGLHFADVAKLIELLQRLVDAGNSVLVIEHHPDVIKCADHVVDLGPEGGEAGGEIVAQGTPEAVARAPRSHTGRMLAPILRRSGAAPVGRAVTASDTALGQDTAEGTGPARSAGARAAGRKA